MNSPVRIFEDEYLTDMDYAEMHDDEDSINPDELEDDNFWNIEIPNNN
tara:strand:+ start:58 stop:201 length:144 start_codon:yes stop_codon:yes gene_type:complete